MAANIIPPIQLHSTVRTTAGHHSSDSQPKTNNWWTPLFGWSSEPDYINTDKNRTNNSTLSAKSSANSGSDLDQRPVKSRISPVKFTDEKARKLRMLTSETESFHDAMYHSAIASRFASDFSDRFDT
ncbi:hypothetical protein HanPI659440_Chr03g0096001 [Helianthus annuus]|nr:hypothetical protein HanPI659440_Chr03g0096001 [Helianthus annuus]